MEKKNRRARRAIRAVTREKGRPVEAVLVWPEKDFTRQNGGHFGVNPNAGKVKGR